MFKINATTRLKASEDNVIAPSDSYKEKNERDLEKQQDQRESDEHKESTSDGTSKEGTSVHDMGASVRRLTASKDDMIESLETRIKAMQKICDTKSGEVKRNAEEKLEELKDKLYRLRKGL